MKGGCEIMRCRSDGEVRYLGHYVCNPHWDRYTQATQPPDALKLALGIPVQEEVAMAKKVKKAKAAKPDVEETDGRGKRGKTSGLKVAEFWRKLFADNFKGHMSDAALATSMNKEFPSDAPYDEADVAAHRGLFNKGKLRFQTHATKPKEPLHRHDAKGNELPLWGEKGKLRKAGKTPVPDDIEFGTRKVRVKRVRAAKRSKSK